MKPIAFILAFMLLLGCSSDEFKAKKWVERGQETTAPFKMQMQSALEASLLDGVITGIDVCRVTAPKIAMDLSSESVKIGRTSHRLRNPGNAPQAWQESILSNYASSSTALPPTAVQISASKVGYVEPIYTKPVCLICHGEQLRPEVSDLLARHYPGDEALGFKQDEFRGLIWVEFNTDLMD